MKKIIVISLSLIFGVVIFGSCATHSQCPAYGHYSQLEQPTDNDTNI